MKHRESGRNVHKEEKVEEDKEKALGRKESLGNVRIVGGVGNRLCKVGGDVESSERERSAENAVNEG